MAARYLCTHDYTILARNYRTPFGEVDLIAQKDGVLVYVEVKYRSSNDYGDPLEAVDRRKQRQICKVANYHYAGYAAGQEMDCRFDVIGIYGDGSIRHIPNVILFSEVTDMDREDFQWKNKEHILELEQFQGKRDRGFHFCIFPFFWHIRA